MAQVYKTKSERLVGSDFHEVNKQAFKYYQKIKSKSRRKPYIRSAYFHKDKIFLAQFWQHLFEKANWRDRVRRIKYFPPAIELIQNSKFDPKSKENPNKPNEILHRFTGITKGNHIFHIQVKENKKTGKKYLISVFPEQ